METSKKLRRLSLFLFAVLALGCGHDGPELGSVSGRFTYQGKPVANASVMFQPVDKGPPSVAATDEDGRYTLLFNNDREGAVLGEHKVYVTLEDSYLDEQGDLIEIADTLPESCGDGSMKATVKSGSNEIDFDIPAE